MQTVGGRAERQSGGHSLALRVSATRAPRSQDGPQRPTVIPFRRRLTAAHWRPLFRAGPKQRRRRASLEQPNVWLAGRPQTGNKLAESATASSY